MAMIELYGGQRSLAFVLNTADYECDYLLCAIDVSKYGRYCEIVICLLLTLRVQQNSFVIVL